MFLLFSATSFLCVTLLCVTKNFWVWKSDKSTSENLHNEKSYLITHEYVALLCKFNEQQQQICLILCQCWWLRRKRSFPSWVFLFLFFLFMSRLWQKEVINWIKKIISRMGYSPTAFSKTLGGGGEGGVQATDLGQVNSGWYLEFVNFNTPSKCNLYLCCID